MLVVGHPGHELCVHAWSAAEKPDLAILTAGSRSGGDLARLQRSLALARRRGLSPIDLTGAFEDRALYRLVMDRSAEALHVWADDLRDRLLAAQTDCVVVDAWQGYSIAHDLTHLIAHAAVAEAEHRSGRTVELLEFAPVPEDRWPRRSQTPLRLKLDLSPRQARAKLRDAWSFEDLRAEMEQLRLAPHLISQERLYVSDRNFLSWRASPKPYYEAVGEARVAAGIYQEALRREHFDAIAAPFVGRIRSAAPGCAKALHSIGGR
jgi:hypothetical protein